MKYPITGEEMVAQCCEEDARRDTEREAAKG
jgi:hypothetical protein